MFARRVALLAGLLLAGLCSSVTAQPLASDPRVAAALELARTWVEAQRAYERIPGVSAAVIHDQEVLWSGGFGSADVEAARPAGAGTIYSICSISKLFTSVAVMRERDAGRLRLEDPVGKHLPWFRLKRAEGEGDVTVEGLLTHASGLPRESDYPYWSPPDFRFPTREQIIEKIGSQQALYSPETNFQYSNLGLTLAGEVVAAVSGVPYDRYVRSNILKPLGLSSTTPEMPESERGKRLATGYTALDREGKREPMPFFVARGIAPAAGYASTAGDLGRFASWQFRLLQKGGSEVLKATTLREMHRVHWVEPDFETLWGLGFTVWKSGDKMFVGHGGSCPGYRSQILLMPQEKIATVFLSNAQGVAARQWTQRLYDIMEPAVRAAVKEKEKAKAPDPAMRRYAGTYSARPWAGEIAVLPWEEGLAMLELPTMDPVKDLEKFKKVGENTFRLIRKDETLGEEVVFEIGPDGKAPASPATATSVCASTRRSGKRETIEESHEADPRRERPVKSGMTRLLFSFSRVLLLAGLLATIAVTCVYIYHLAVNIRSDTTSVTNAAFIITGTLSALCFSWAQSLLAEDKDRERILFAGERLLHGSLFLILASVLKYAALTLMTYQTTEIPRPALHWISDVFGILAVPLFLFAVGDAMAGVVVALRILWPRTSPYLAPPHPPK